MAYKKEIDSKRKATEKWLIESHNHMNAEANIIEKLSQCYDSLIGTKQRIQMLVEEKGKLKMKKVASDSCNCKSANKLKDLTTFRKENVAKKWIDSQKILNFSSIEETQNKNLDKLVFKSIYKASKITQEPPKFQNKNLFLNNNERTNLSMNKSIGKLKRFKQLPLKNIETENGIKVFATNKSLNKNRSSKKKKPSEQYKDTPTEILTFSEPSETEKNTFSSKITELSDVADSSDSSRKINTSLSLSNNTNTFKLSTAFSSSFQFGTEPVYSICGGNGSHIIEEILNSYGWKKAKDKNDENFKLKWCELKSSINFLNFREGEQMVNHIPNSEAFTNKHKMIKSIREYSKLMNDRFKSDKLDFIPESYGLDDPKEKDKFMSVYKEEEIWICKPTGRNQGKGIFLVRNSEDFERAIKCDVPLNPVRFKPLNRIVQRYLSEPLLIEKRKFDIRCYMLIANTQPFLVLYHNGYVRLSLHEYDKESSSMVTHLTNQYIQKKDPKYNEKKEETLWSMDRFNDYFNKHIAPQYKLEPNWVNETMTNKMQNISKQCFNAVKNRLERKIGYFELYGLDFLIDKDLKVWIIEINTNPSMATNCVSLKTIVPDLLKETLDISIECFQKRRKKKSFMPLTKIKKFQVLFPPMDLTEDKNANRVNNMNGKRYTEPISKMTKLDDLEKEENSKKLESCSKNFVSLNYDCSQEENNSENFSMYTATSSSIKLQNCELN